MSCGSKKLDCFNIQAYRFDSVIRRIVTSTNRYIRKNQSNKEEHIKHMLHSLFLIFKDDKEGVINILKGTSYVDVAFVQGILLEANYPELKDGNKRKQVRSIQVKKIEDVDELQFVKLLKDASQLLKNSKRAWVV